MDNQRNVFNDLGLSTGKAICYSGFREGHRPGDAYPSYEEVKEDLMLLDKQWQYLRLFDCDQHALTVLEVIQHENMDFKIMLGAYIEAELNNFNCPWNGGIYEEEQLERNCQNNQQKISKLIDLGITYPDVIFSLSVGNEACVEWTDHYVNEFSVQQYAKQVKEQAPQPVTFCENYVPWLYKLNHLAEELDFISIHTYPVWEYRHISEAIDYSKENYYSVANKYPDKSVVITEAGWATNSNGRGIHPNSVNQEYQKIYFDQMMEWAEKEHILVFFFEAFDEYWKGSPEPMEPEKHWGLFNIDRSPKLAAQPLIQ